MGFEYDREAAADASRAHVAYDAALSSYFAMAPEARSTDTWAEVQRLDAARRVAACAFPARCACSECR